MSPATAMSSAALSLAALGWPVFPADVQPFRPRCANGYRDATTDPERLKRYWHRHPCVGVAIATGRISGIAVVDVDVKHVDGIEVINRLIAENGWVDRTPVARTPSAGLHLYFRYPEGHELGCRTGFVPGLDLRAEGGAVAAPPSAAKDGRAYTWEVDPFTVELALMPYWLIKLVERPPLTASGALTFTSPQGRLNYVVAAVRNEARNVAEAPAGTRNHALFKASANLGSLVAGGLLPDGEAQRVLEAAAEACGLVRDDGVRQVRATIRSGLRAGARAPRRFG